MPKIRHAEHVAKPFSNTQKKSYFPHEKFNRSRDTAFPYGAKKKVATTFRVHITPLSALNSPSPKLRKPSLAPFVTINFLVRRSPLSFGFFRCNARYRSLPNCVELRLPPGVFELPGERVAQSPHALLRNHQTKSRRKDGRGRPFKADRKRRLFLLAL